MIGALLQVIAIVGVLALAMLISINEYGRVNSQDLAMEDPILPEPLGFNSTDSTSGEETLPLVNTTAAVP